MKPVSDMGPEEAQAAYDSVTRNLSIEDLRAIRENDESRLMHASVMQRARALYERLEDISDFDVAEGWRRPSDGESFEAKFRERISTAWSGDHLPPSFFK